MSADNWAFCPRCVVRVHAAKVAALRDLTENVYGTVPPDEYMRRAAVVEAMPDRPDVTLREDYSFYLEAPSGEFSASYRGSCAEDGCGFVFEFKHKGQASV